MMNLYVKCLLVFEEFINGFLYEETANVYRTLYLILDKSILDIDSAFLW
jgi:hypothetical protein